MKSDKLKKIYRLLGGSLPDNLPVTELRSRLNAKIEKKSLEKLRELKQEIDRELKTPKEKTDLLVTELINIQSKINQLIKEREEDFKKLASKIEDLEKKDDSPKFDELNQKILSLANRGGGSPNQKVSVNGTWATKRYADINFAIPGAVVTNDDTNRVTKIDTSKTPYIQFDTTATPQTSAPGLMQWNSVDGTLDIGMLNGSILQVGQEQYVYGKAQGAISNGDIVQEVSAQGDHILFKKANASEIIANPRLILGVATNNIANGEYGYATSFGKVNDTYTTGWTAGDILYFDNSTGALTNTEPDAPERRITMGRVIKEATGGAENGVVFVRIAFGFKLTDLDDIDGTALTVDGQIPVWHDTEGYFDFDKNINNYTPLNDTTTFLKLNQTSSQTIINGQPIWDTLTASKVVFTDASKKFTSTGIGTSAQFIKGDGSLDSSTYLTSLTGAMLLDQTTPQSIINGQPIFTQGLKITAGQDIRPSADSTTAINISQADGTDFVTFDTTNKRVGIGTTSPSEKFSVSTDGIDSYISMERVNAGNNVGFAWKSASTAKWYNYMPGNSDSLRWYLAGDKLILDNTGNLKITKIIQPINSDSTTGIQFNKADGTTNIVNIDTTNSRVGIGTTGPSSLLHLSSNVDSTPKLLIEDTSSAGYPILFQVKAKDGADPDFRYTRQSSAAGDFRFMLRGPASAGANWFALHSYDKTDQQLIIHSNGYVGINKTDPNYNLDVAGNTRISRTLACVEGLSVGGYISDYNTTDNVFDMNYGGTNNRVRVITRGIVVDGNSGFGTLSPDKKVEINSTDGNNLRLTYNDADGSATNYVDFLVSSSGDLTITPSGNDILLASDSIKLNFGAGTDMAIYYDGTAGNIDTDLVAPSDLTIDCGGTGSTAKTVVLEVPVYNDANVGGLVLRTGGTAPGVVEWLDNDGDATGIYTIGFANGEQGSGSIEIPHDYKEGTNLSFHIHYGLNDAPTGTDNIRFDLIYNVQRDGTTFVDATTIDSTDVAVDTQYKTGRIDFTAITGTNFKIGDQFNFTIKRTTAAGDAFSGEVLIQTLGFHYQCDTLGSRQIGTK